MRILVSILLLSMAANLASAQSIAINNDGSAPHNSAMLDVKSATKGLLLPRTSTSSRLAIVNPAKGLMLFDTTSNSFWFYNGGAWLESATGSPTNFWTLNANNIFSNNAGNVGIGTNTPTNKLAILADYDAHGITHTAGSITIASYIGRGGSGWIGTKTNHPFNINTNDNGTPNMTFHPNYTIDIRGAQPRLNFYDHTSGTNLFSGSMGSIGRNIELAAYLGLIGQPGNLILQADDVGAGGIPLSAGNIGVGTRTPGYKFQVEKAGWGIMQSNGGILAGLYVAGGGGWLGTQSAHPLYFCTGLLNVNNQAQMMIAVNGNVGIGTLNPTHKLSVNGNIRSKEVVVESGWADFVFRNDYKLRPLTEVEKYIEENDHLPDIPSATEIQQNGLGIGEMQTKMMQKIEELTLYLIEANKQIEILKKQVCLLTKKKDKIKK